MRKIGSLLFSASILLLTAAGAEEAKTNFDLTTSEEHVETQTPFKPFTGRVTRNKVRLRLQPNLESPIIKQLPRGEFLLVTDETEEFYAVKPQPDTKAYIFRTFVLDGIVEGNRVNVRLEPTLDAPIIARMSTGERVEGEISTVDNRWIEFAPPESVNFYVSKIYLEEAGDANKFAAIKGRRKEAERLLTEAYLTSQTELEKPFNTINLDGVYATFNNVIGSYSDLPEETEKAEQLLTLIQNSYLQKKVVALEGKGWSSEEISMPATDVQDERLAQLQEELAGITATTEEPQDAAPDMIEEKWAWEHHQPKPLGNMANWAPNEQLLFERWSRNQHEATLEGFYDEQKQDADVLVGIIEPYNHIIKNKPGDYVLIDSRNQLPVAYLYSTVTNLSDKVGQEVILFVAPRPNNYFAFPAYFVLDIEQQ